MSDVEDEEKPGKWQSAITVANKQHECTNIVSRGTEVFHDIDTALGKHSLMTSILTKFESVSINHSLELQVAATCTTASEQEGKNTNTKTTKVIITVIILP